jgi:minor extracellular serine protease Vpr
MQRIIKWIGSLAIPVAMLAISALAQEVEELTPIESPEPSADAAGPAIQSPELWFVELTSPPRADGGSSAAVKRDKRAFRAAATSARLKYTERFAYDTLFNGFSVRIDRSELTKLWRLPGVKALYPVGIVPAPAAPEELGADLATALAMTGADIAQNTLGLTGQGIRVGVIDTGLDYNHPDLGGNGVAETNSAAFPTSRVVAGFDFVGDAYNADPTSPTFDPNPHPDPFPDDCAGHGTHVSGIVGANGAIKGVAPGVVYGAYRVFGCAGSANEDVILAAMERALADNMQVINMSLGDAFNNWPQAVLAQAGDRLVNRGVVLVCSIGNSGASGVYSAGAPGVGKKVIGVAAFDNTHVALTTFNVTPANITAGYGNAAGTDPAPTSGSLPLEKTGTPTTANDGCADSFYSGLDVAGKAVLIRRGTCTFYEKARRAQLMGAAAVVLYNNAAGRFSPTVAVQPVLDQMPVTIPVVAVSDTEGVAINNAIASAPQTLHWTDQTGTFVNPTGNLISSFSSFGTAADLSLKPDIGAPGGLIRSTYPLEQGAYATISGTSMSSPHTAGAVALLLEARPRTPAQAVRSILQNSADPRPWFGNPGLGFLDNTHRQGAGMLDIPGAVLSMTSIEPGKISLGESEFGPVTRTLSIKNHGTSTRTYDLSHVPALSTGGSTFSPSFFTGFATVDFSAPSVTVPAGGTASVDVTITANPGLADRSLYGGYLVATAQGGGPVWRVPYAGFKGDYQSILVLNPAANANGNPLLRPALSLGPSVPVTINPNADEVAWVLFHLDHQVQRLRMEVFDAMTGRAWHRAFEEKFLPRNATATGFFAVPFDGTTVNGRRLNVLPNGQYVIKLSVLKPLGDDSNPAHTESWTSPVITIDRH